MESSSAPVARPASAGLDPRRWWALPLPCGAFFMVLLDSFKNAGGYPRGSTSPGMRSAIGAARPPGQLPSQRQGGRQRAPQPEGAPHLTGGTPPTRDP
jgi:hypothetical protein